MKTCTGTATAQEEASRMAELAAEQGAGTLVRRLVEAAGPSEATLYDCAVVVYNLAGAAADSAALRKDLMGVGEGGVLPALEKLAGVRCVAREEEH